MKLILNFINLSLIKNENTAQPLPLLAEEFEAYEERRRQFYEEVYQKIKTEGGVRFQEDVKNDRTIEQCLLEGEKRVQFFGKSNKPA